MGQVRNAYKTSVEILKGRYYLKDLQAAARIILKWILKKYILRIRILFICLRKKSN
jgi:hypothetical protein